MARTKSKAERILDAEIAAGGASAAPRRSDAKRAQAILAAELASEPAELAEPSGEAETAEVAETAPAKQVDTLDIAAVLASESGDPARARARRREERRARKAHARRDLGRVGGKTPADVAAKVFRPKVIGVLAAVVAAIAIGVVVGMRMSFSNSTDVWDGTADTTWYSEGMTSMTITTAEQLAGMRKLTNDGVTLEGIAFKLDRNLDLYDIPTKPIGDGFTEDGQQHRFCGSFDGCGHTISGILVEEDMWDHAGLFGVVFGGDICNLTVEGKVTGQVRVGGIVGELSGGSLRNCTNRCAVSSLKTATSYYPVSADVGGVCGAWLGILPEDSSAEISNLVNEGEVQARACSAGGVVGTIANSNRVNLSVRDLHNYGKVTVYCESDDRDEAAGGVVGVVGALGADTFSNLVNDGDASCSTVLAVGGIFGSFMPPAFVQHDDADRPWSEGATVSTCTNNGRIAANADDERAHVGGIVGHLEDPEVVFENCENTGELAATNGKADNLYALDGALIWDEWEDEHPVEYF